MQISIIDHGPLKAKVSITIDGQSITFPETSYLKLVDLMIALGAEPDGDAFRGESHWVLNTDPIRMAQSNVALRLELDRRIASSQSLVTHLEEVEFTLQQRTEKLQGEIDLLRLDNDRIGGLLNSAVEERQTLYHASFWRRIRWAFQRQVH